MIKHYCDRCEFELNDDQVNSSAVFQTYEPIFEGSTQLRPEYRITIQFQKWNKDKHAVSTEDWWITAELCEECAVEIVMNEHFKEELSNEDR